MPSEGRPGPTPAGVLIGLLVLFGLLIAVLEESIKHPGLAHTLAPYVRFRGLILEHWILSCALALAALIVVGFLLVGFKRLSASIHRWRDRMAGLTFKKESYILKDRSFSLGTLLRENPAPEKQVVLGLSDAGEPVYLTDEARSMHLHVLGQTGSGKTKSVLEPLMFQDLWRGRGILAVDGKGSQENEERLVSMAAAAGRLGDVKVFTLNPFRRSHTYNPLHLVAGADPQAVAERVFSTFSHDMDNPFYRDQASRMFTGLVCAFASTGKPFTMLDVAAALASRKILALGLEQSSDRKARAQIEAQLRALGRDAAKTFTGLLAAVQRYDFPSVNACDPDIVLERDLDAASILGFFLPANYYKQLARYLGLCVLQHVQQVGALRQLDRSRSQQPLYVYADEFYTFAYEGFTDAVNKLRDAQISLLLSHQTISDLDKVSPEFARGIWDNTRNKIVLYQNDPDVCDRISKALGTEKDVELTVRRSVDRWLNSVSTQEASSKEVDVYRCHPNRIKSLSRGQAYLAQDAAFVAVHLQMMPTMPPAAPPPPKTGRVQGLGLHELFVSDAQGASARSAPS